jgi:hypothetical protein
METVPPLPLVQLVLQVLAVLAPLEQPVLLQQEQLAQEFPA